MTYDPRIEARERQKIVEEIRRLAGEPSKNRLQIAFLKRRLARNDEARARDRAKGRWKK